MGTPEENRLAELLTAIEEHDEDYGGRYGMILEALHVANRIGYPVGLDYDHASPDNFDGYRALVYLELPTGQVSWHMIEYGGTWDEHTTEEKYQRTRAYVAQVADPPPAE